MSTAQKRLRELLAKRKAEIAEKPKPPEPETKEILLNQAPLVPHSVIQYNEKQALAIEYANRGMSFALTGQAGSGKTTSVTGIVESLIKGGKVGRFHTTKDHKHINLGSPAIVFVSFTNKAVNNLKKVLPADIRANAMTIHKLLEYAPEEVSSLNDEGEYTKSMVFRPSRCEKYKLPDIDVLFIDEATMTNVPLWNRIVEALPDRPIQIILVGDINQLPPVFGKPIFIHAVTQGMPAVELTEVYRQALDSPILALATAILKGKPMKIEEVKEKFERETERGTLEIIPWKKQHSATAATVVMCKWLTERIDDKSYDPTQDIIITPYNESFGTIAMNKEVATKVAKDLNAEVFEIYAGKFKQYFREGERVLYNKSDAQITKIERNPKYLGKLPRPPSNTMNYAGIESDPIKIANTSSGVVDDAEAFLDAMSDHIDDGESATNQASHKITVYIPDLDKEVVISASGDINKLELGYAITIYKSQGSEYRKVLLLTHSSQGGQLFRESLYTGITRAKKHLVIVCSPDLFIKGITKQRLPGNTLAEKVKTFNLMIKLSKQGSDEIPKGDYMFTAVKEV